MARSAVIHPNITPLLGISLDFDRPRTPCLVFPYYRNGNIISYLKTHWRVNKLPLVSYLTP
jgi:serine/threonine protein kinase